MIQSLLIANRGEIACRIIRTARAMGVRTVAVYSDADAKALHVRQADEAVHIGPSPARESYLVGDKIIAAAKQTGAEAIHPGYGFLSENADFAQAVIDAGLVWVGPAPDSIRAMGLKDAAKARMIAAGVPVTPGYLGEDQSPERLQAEADAIGYPVLIKAVAGGGGKGMRRVESAADFADALLSCQREAASSFGDDRVLIEKYILSPRHIEVQVFGDAHGNVVHLFERDCSLQRRHQKVIEEAPAPGMDEATREAICAAAVRAAKAVDYVGAGTIEFIADASDGLRADRIWFMEMNTRLQVEHPVTEEITGVDLVEWQLRVASGEVLPKRQDELSIDGWAIEARLYAEDPKIGFLPSTGPLTHVMLPDHQVRVDTGIHEGGAVTPFYDPMIAKLIATGNDRPAAIDRLRKACETTAVWPVKTNAAFLARCLANEQFLAGTMDTGLLAASAEMLIPPNDVPDAVLQAGAMAITTRSLGVTPHQIGDTLIGGDLAAATPWTGAFGFRLNAVPQRVIHLLADGHLESVQIDNPWGQLDAWVELADDMILSGVNDGRVFAISEARAAGTATGAAADGAILSPMPGRIIAVEVAAGASVAKGEKLVTLEAMKMEHSLVAPFDGVVAELNAETGGQVSEGALLVRIERAEEE
ncbi:acetyl/propionyl/methylcrotonyl-CoA carboxylase subunit alpha [Sphingomonas gilva]|uniref:Acetyl/propionyl/methylcrotonyl-CoA carboxylase subunit alpha n=1 Tax=Sphingomonas gilva TaxID=2305907 RepID=A0A396RUX6_9SPHN|nr:acetyl/propionyl/methylcrotonyl-CoA carboxylase subunit alpha [Sphingomonas gilva]RHW18263.1 acetyl/propionyl/methylcrotonyl-CoA carboxylase subunit alpha [Sphingomonas gilva]